jgi:hypothetical protein
MSRKDISRARTKDQNTLAVGNGPQPSPDQPSLIHKTKSDATAFWTSVSSIAACLAALFAGWAALETQRNVVEASKATKAGVWLQLLSQYEAPEMLAAMKELRTWQQNSPRDFADAFEKLLIKTNRTADEQHLVDSLDADRRRVAGFFGNVRTLCEGRIIDEDFAKRTFGGGTYRFLADVQLPMEHAKLEAMLKTRALSTEDEAEADRSEKDEIEFYKRVFH